MTASYRDTVGGQKYSSNMAAILSDSWFHRHNKIIYGQLKKIKRNKILPLIFS